MRTWKRQPVSVETIVRTVSKNRSIGPKAGDNDEMTLPRCSGLQASLWLPTALPLIGRVLPAPHPCTTGSCSAASLGRVGWETVLELMATAVDDETFRPGMIAVVQTAGDMANWQPHLHALVSRGGWSADGEWVPVPFVDERSAELLFRHKVMRLLQDEGLLSEERTELAAVS